MLGLGSTDDATFDPLKLDEGAGVPDGVRLASLVRAAFDGDETSLATERSAAADEMGHDLMIDALAVYANFSMMTRIADATGTPLDQGTAAMSADMRDALNLNDLTSARL